MRLKRLKKVTEADQQTPQQQNNSSMNSSNQSSSENNKDGQQEQNLPVSQKAAQAINEVIKTMVTSIPETMKKVCPEFNSSNADAANAIKAFESFKQNSNAEDLGNFFKSMQEFIKISQEKENAPKPTTESFLETYQRKLNEERFQKFYDQFIEE